MSAENKAVVQQVHNVISSGELDGLDAFIAVDFKDHSAPPEVAPGLAGAKQNLGMFHTVFSDFHLMAEDMIANEDKVVARFKFVGVNTGEFMGMPATGKDISVTGIEIFRFADGKIVERWGEFDMMGMMQQLGAMG